jgi:hypothetical protein
LRHTSRRWSASLHVVLDVRLALGAGSLVQMPCGTAEVGDARLGRDAGAREHHDLVGIAEKGGEAIELIGGGHQPATLRGRASGAPWGRGAPLGWRLRAQGQARTAIQIVEEERYEATPCTWSSASRWRW